MRLYVFILLFFVGSVFGRNIANTVSTPWRIFKVLYKLQSKSSFGKELFQKEYTGNTTSADTSDMDNNIPELPKLGTLVYIIFVEILETICIDEVLKNPDLLHHRYYWIEDIMCNISKTLFFADNPIIG
ncbi:uncharacterized protein [Polyergus mexicanus]|uniref:uncharacterized protein n=1 Tax=Polyergus mexicanus TaxID=615972 RepID=UPI0038B50D57